MRLLITFFLLLTGFSGVSQAQGLNEKGVPPLKNFTPADYGHQGKIWSIDTSPNGIVYMAADEGLVEYDGRTWNHFTGSDGITRSVLVDSDSLIYTGSDLDFGVWNRNRYNDFQYTSLYPFKEDLNQINEEFWGLHKEGGNVYFVSSSNIYLYTGGNLTKIPAPNQIDNSFLVGDEFFFVDESAGLYRLQNLSPVQVSPLGNMASLEIKGMYRQGERLFLVTQNSGLYQLDSGVFTPVPSRLSDNLSAPNVFSFEKINDTYLAFGTVLNGLYIADMDGNIIHHITKNKGLQNNTILSLHYSEAGHLWLGMDFGVSFLDLRNEFTFFYDYLGDFGTGYSAALESSGFYLGTNQGLYRSDWEDLNDFTELTQFELLSGSEGQVWTISRVNGQLLMGHDRGLFEIVDGSVQQIAETQGVWTIQTFDDYLLAGTYNGISIFSREQEDENWRFLKQMGLILGSCNQIIVDEDRTIWVNIPNYGIIRATLDQELYPQDRRIFLSEQFGGQDHTLLQDDSGISVMTDGQNFRYDENQSRFVSTDREIVNSQISDIQLRNAQPVELNDDYEFYPVYNGFALRKLTHTNGSSASPPELVFRELEAYNNDQSALFYDGAEIGHELNNIRVASIVPNRRDVQYQYRINEEDEWSNWSDDGIFELVGLGSGDYKLSVRAKADENLTPVSVLSFTIATPWYSSWTALIIYFFGVSVLFYMMYMWQGMSLSKQKKYLLMNQRNSLREQHERYNRQLKEAEEDKLRAEYEKMKAQLKNKTIELATKAKENDEKQKILQTINEKIDKLKQNPDSFKRASDELQRMIDSHIDSGDNTFEIQIDELHQEFFKSLRNKYPDLTRYDLRLCVYIKMGFDSKEISDLLNIKPSSVYISRSRLRKKLDLDTEEDLHAFLNSV